MVSLFSSLFATLLPLEATLPTMFGSMGFTTGNVSTVHFNQGGNDYAGLIFWLSGEVLSTPENITVNGGSQSINCSYHLKGLYYNNMRGWRLWPLDTGSLSILQTAGTGYGTMTLSGGFYTNCTNVSGYPAITSNEIFGYIEHNRSGITLQMIAGVNYDFTHNTLLSGSPFSNTLVKTGGTYSGWIWDNYGGIAQIASGQFVGRCGDGAIQTGEQCDDGNTSNGDGCSDICQIESVVTTGMCVGFGSDQTVTQGQNFSLTCSGTNVTGYIIDVRSGNAIILSGTVYTSANHYTRAGGSTLAVGNYTGTCAVLTGNGVGPQCGVNVSLHVAAAGACNNSFVGNVIPGGGAIFASGVSYFSNSTGITIDISATENVAYTITGNFTTTPLVGSYTGTTINSHIYLNQVNARNTLHSTFTTGACTYYEGVRYIYVDTIPPTTTTLVTPASGTNLCSSGASIFSWTAASDTGVGLSGYRYSIISSGGTIYSATVPANQTGVALLTQNMVLGNYTRIVQAIDAVGNTSTSATGSFVISPTTCAQGVYGSGIQIIGSLSSIVNANLNTIYSSEIFYVRGLTGPTLLSVNLGTLIVNGTGIGTTGMVTATTPLRIEMVSSSQYNHTVTSTVSVAGLTGTFNITTKDNSCQLTTSQEELISNVYDLLKTQYNGNTSILNDFLATFQSILGDEVDISQDCSLEYLLQLINNDLDTTSVDTSNHIAPNCKAYQISYDNGERAYYSPMMKNRYLFINRETLIRHIDFYNAGDCHINTYGNVSWSDNRNTDTIHVAPNGKIYHIQSMGGGFTSTEFVGSKYFDNLSTMTYYIDGKNPATDVRDHHVDASFAPVTYLAPNSKEYRLYKTNRGYMSYRLMKVKYFNSLLELEDYINRNNPVKK
ncbi:MAG: myxococcus cysteine-rich repeat containing protein [candidate division SR1 bacterium]|nr:myxococcus cysteine-rich repeat containing protein [candidate division SR1 bacterium]